MPFWPPSPMVPRPCSPCASRRRNWTPWSSGAISSDSMRPQFKTRSSPKCAELSLDQNWDYQRCPAMRTLQPPVDRAADALFQGVRVGHGVLRCFGQGFLHRTDRALKVEVLHEPAREEVGIFGQFPGIQVNQGDNRDDSLLREDAPIAQRIFINNAHGRAVDVNMGGRYFADYFGFAVY